MDDGSSLLFYAKAVLVYHVLAQCDGLRIDLPVDQSIWELASGTYIA